MWKGPLTFKGNPFVAHLFDHLLGLLQVFVISPEDDLIIIVIDGDLDVGPLADPINSLNLRLAHDREEAGVLDVITTVLHVFAPGLDQHQALFKIEGLRGVEGRVLSEAVPGGHVKVNVGSAAAQLLAQGLQAGHADRKDGGLGVAGVLQEGSLLHFFLEAVQEFQMKTISDTFQPASQLLMGMLLVFLPAECRDLITQKIVGALESIFGHGVMIGDIQSHTRVLGALPRKDEGDFFSIHFTLVWTR